MFNDKKMTAQEMANVLIDYGYATEEDIDLVTKINGYNEKAMTDILYVRAGYNTFDQLNGLND